MPGTDHDSPKYLVSNVNDILDMNKLESGGVGTEMEQENFRVNLAGECGIYC